MLVIADGLQAWQGMGKVVGQERYERIYSFRVDYRGHSDGLMDNRMNEQNL